jgi:hypothetical protein
MMTDLYEKSHLSSSVDDMIKQNLRSIVEGSVDTL